MVGEEQDPGVVGYVPLMLAGARKGDFSEGCPCHPPRLDGSPMLISRDNLFLGGLCGREHEKDKDTAVGNFFLKVENPKAPQMWVK